MKIFLINILLLLTLSSCNGQGVQNSLNRKKETRYEEIGRSTISFGKHNAILGFKPADENHYFIYLRAESGNDTVQETNFYELKISDKGDSMNSLPISPDRIITDYMESDNAYYSVITERRTMGGYTKDFLNKYNKNWKLIWSKKIGKPKNPNGMTVFTLTHAKEILLVTDERIPKETKTRMSVRRYNLEGKLISENLMHTKESCNPTSIIASADGNYYLTAIQYDHTTNANSLFLIKLNPQGENIWSKNHPALYPRQTMLTHNGDLVFYGSNYSLTEDGKNHYQYLKIIVLDKDGNLKWQKDIKKNDYEMPGNFLETRDGNYLFSGTVTPIKDKGDRAYLFELNKNGDLTFERIFDDQVGIGNVPFILRTKGQITMIGQKWMGKFGAPFKDVIQIIKLQE